MPGNLDFMKVLVGGDDIIFGQEEFLGVFNFLKSSIEIAARYPEEEENKKDGTSDHAEKEVEFLVVPKRIEVLICDPVAIVKSKRLNLKLGSISSNGFSCPENILISAIIPPRKDGIVDEISFLGHSGSDVSS
jgi:hypothetical protein